MAQIKAKTKAKTRAKPKTTEVKNKKTKRKIKARNITNHTVQLHLPGGRYVRIGPSEVYALTELECHSRVLKKLERENIVHINWPGRKAPSKGEVKSITDTTPSAEKNEDKEKAEKQPSDKPAKEPGLAAKSAKEIPKGKVKELSVSSTDEQKEPLNNRENISSKKPDRFELTEKKNETPGDLTE